MCCLFHIARKIYRKTFDLLKIFSIEEGKHFPASQFKYYIRNICVISNVCASFIVCFESERIQTPKRKLFQFPEKTTSRPILRICCMVNFREICSIFFSSVYI